jgi:DNA-binding PadR family transcriptional regulator
LYVIAGLKQPHGLAVKAELDDYYEQEINHDWIYPNLEGLVEKGLLEKGELENHREISLGFDSGQMNQIESTPQFYPPR